VGSRLLPEQALPPALALFSAAAMLLSPRHVGAVVLGTWALAQGGVVAETPWHLIPYAGAVALAVLLWRLPRVAPG
jgi:hypothetical protein